MQLRVVGTGSTGNTYILTNGEETLVLDAGLPFLAVKKALDFNIRTIKAVLVSHSHGDHSKYAHEYETAGIPVWKPYMSESLRQEAQFGGYRIQSVPMIHDVPCVGYLIGHKELGKMLYATDTEYIKYRFKNLSTILIEANYSDDLIDRTEAKYRHVLTGHMNINTTVEFIKANVNTHLTHIILCHLSQMGADPEAFREAVKAVAPVGCSVGIAEPGAVFDVGEIPF